jgi:hypothetical protein
MKLGRAIAARLPQQQSAHLVRRARARVRDDLLFHRIGDDEAQ